MIYPRAYLPCGLTGVIWIANSVIYSRYDNYLCPCDVLQYNLRVEYSTYEYYCIIRLFILSAYNIILFGEIVRVPVVPPAHSWFLHEISARKTARACARCGPAAYYRYYNMRAVISYSLYKSVTRRALHNIGPCTFNI